ncbi:quinone-dependent dihydroorotate dehydrogenase [Paralimibaculum aggregatum]|uniref:Dihydroorotate dehydrogenase (quinone) n=1 Tax=Paralimibaculum aggregatum TaxID=3036245 RepID=A0ABQ6LM96_9RHOB|nr:quinone-dependent dihydroorotate dehydrogenase [Limibaculum sp. NKW23]GMG84087.1 quinone-dependent dihydroorotate dehydrogenase [Limibaculum sp. NKW23]
MSALERAGLRALGLLDAERAHGLALRALAAGLGPSGGPVTAPRLATRLAGLELPNPVGIAAGFDKNAAAIGAILRAGPGFAEIGAVTPRPQPGNPRPRLFRLREDGAAINRFGFNNDGMEAVARRLEAARSAGVTGVIGVNLGANKDSDDRAADYAAVLARLYPFGDFFTVNVSSPNTERLRELQGRAALERLLEGVLERRAGLGPAKPVFLKIAPDLADAELADIAEVARALPLDGLIATNTTTAREGLASPLAVETGGLSGRPLMARSTEVVRALYRLTGGRLPIIGVGGIASAADAHAKIRAGASAVQLYTALAYEGLSLAGKIARDLAGLLEADGVGSLADAVGRDA